MPPKRKQGRSLKHKIPKGAAPAAPAAAAAVAAAGPGVLGTPEATFIKLIERHDHLLLDEAPNHVAAKCFWYAGRWAENCRQNFGWNPNAQQVNATAQLLYLYDPEATLPYEVDLNRGKLPLDCKGLENHPEVALSQKIVAPFMGYERTSLHDSMSEAEVREWTFECKDYEAFIEAVGKYNANWERVAKAIGKRQASVAAFNCFLDVVAGNWIWWGIVMAGIKDGKRPQDITKDLGTAQQQAFDGTLYVYCRGCMHE